MGHLNRAEIGTFSSIRQMDFTVSFTTRLTAAVFLLFSLAIPPALSQEASYRLGTGDQLRVTVFGHEDLSGEFEVSSTGSITLPLIGDIFALELTLQAVKQAIIDRLEPDYLKKPQVSVEVLNYRPFYIIGEVKNPGSYPYVGGMRVINAIAMAGGFTYRAREKKLMITRAKGGSGEPEPAHQDTLVLPGDVVDVPERFF